MQNSVYELGKVAKTMTSLCRREWGFVSFTYQVQNGPSLESDLCKRCKHLESYICSPCFPKFNCPFSSHAESGMPFQMAHTNALSYFTHSLHVKHLWDYIHHQLASYIHLAGMILHYFTVLSDSICMLGWSFITRIKIVIAEFSSYCLPPCKHNFFFSLWSTIFLQCEVSGMW